MTTNPSPTFDINSLLIGGEQVIHVLDLPPNPKTIFPLGDMFILLIVTISFIGISIVIFQVTLHTVSIIHNLSLPAIQSIGFGLGLLLFCLLLTIPLLFKKGAILAAWVNHKPTVKQNMNNRKAYWTNFRLILVESPTFYSSFYYKNFDGIGLDGNNLVYSRGGIGNYLPFDKQPTETFQWLSSHIANNDAQFTHTYHFAKSQKKNSLKKSWAMAHRKRLLKKV
jgi:hypothetical protein